MKKWENFFTSISFKAVFLCYYYHNERPDHIRPALSLSNSQIVESAFGKLLSLGFNIFFLNLNIPRQQSHQPKELLENTQVGYAHVCVYIFLFTLSTSSSSGLVDVDAGMVMVSTSFPKPSASHKITLGKSMWLFDDDEDEEKNSKDRVFTTVIIIFVSFLVLLNILHVSREI